ncbi:MAG: serine/threonine protein kinase, partial [Nocardiaceae bacterium]|nr:serine/threonine protein kinase [Nocardiaceae bacterium]
MSTHDPKHHVPVEDSDPTVASAPSLHSESESTGKWTGEFTVGPTSEVAVDSIEAGDQLEDFDLIAQLGEGAFARVFLARQRSMQRIVAVKVSQDHGTEPQTLAQLDHDYIVRVFDQRIVPGTGLRLLYMQYLSGGTLHDLLHRVREFEPENRSGQLLLDSVDASLRSRAEIRPSESQTRALVASLSWPETVAWLGRRLAEALDYADKVGVLHRDIKPANILLSSEGVPKLADFYISLARSIGNTSRVAYFGGSLAYMSPEQLEACHPDHLRSAGDIDTRSDLYSLGVVLWELLTGTRPFTDRSQTSTDGSELVAMLNL